MFFLCDFFKTRFHRSPPQFLQETKRFASVKDSSTFSALCDLPETFIKKILGKFRKIFSINFLLKVFRWERWVFAVSSWGIMIFETSAYPFGYFWGCKIDEILALLSFYPWLSVWYVLFGFLLKSSQLFSQVFAKHSFASVLKLL